MQPSVDRYILLRRSQGCYNDMLKNGYLTYHNISVTIPSNKKVPTVIGNTPDSEPSTGSFLLPMLRFHPTCP